MDSGTSSLLFFLLAFAAYFIPYFVARANRKRNAEAIGMLNLFLGWTVLGWIIALVWASCQDAPLPLQQMARPASGGHFCPGCGALRANGNDRFCYACGQPVAV